MKIRILKPTNLRFLSLKPGDEITVTELTPELETLLASEGLDRQHYAEVVRGQESERAVLNRRTERATNDPRPATVSR